MGTETEASARWFRLGNAWAARLIAESQTALDGRRIHLHKPVQLLQQ